MALGGLSLRDLEYAVAIGQLRHFGLAAERCGVSQSALSEQLRKLEGVLGVPLFERTRRRVVPTPQGELLLRRAEALLADAQALLLAARSSASGAPQGRLRLGVIPTLGPYYLPSLLPALRARFPNLVLMLDEARTTELLERVRAADLDAALLALPVRERGLICAPLFFEPFRLVCPQGHRLLSADRLELDALDGEDLLLLEEGHCLRDQALSLCGGSAAGSRFASSLEMLRHMIAAGEGYSLLPALALAERRDLDELLTQRPIDAAEAGRRIGLVWRESDPRDGGFRELSDFLRAHAPVPTVASPASEDAPADPASHAGGAGKQLSARDAAPIRNG